MKKNMVLKDNIVAIEIKRFTRASSEQKIIGAKTKYFRKYIYFFCSNVLKTLLNLLL